MQLIIILSTFLTVYAQNNGCQCDLHASVCDVNCCCDIDCTADDVKVFAKCEDIVDKPSDPNRCFHPLHILFNRSSVEAVPNNDGLLCIYSDNYETRIEYETPQPIADEQEFDNVKTMFTIPSTLKYSPSEPEVHVNYKAGDRIYGRTAEGHSILVNMPSTFVGESCDGTSDIRLFEHRISECAIKVDQSTCTSGTVLDPPLIIASVLMSPRLLYFSSVFSLYTQLVDELDATQFLPVATIVRRRASDGTENEIGTVPIMRWENGVCKDALRRMDYGVIVNGTGGITGFTQTVVVGDVPDGEATVHFETAYIWERYLNRQPSLRTGTPGYNVGASIMTGVMRGDEVVSIEAMSTIAPSTEPCSALTPRVTVQFGVQQMSGCTVELRSSTTEAECMALQQSVIDALVGDPLDRVAIYANASAEDTQDWVPILNVNMPQLRAAIPCPLVTGMNVDIITAKIGNVLNAQSIIIGCMSPPCTSTSGYRIPVVTTVTHIDASEPIEPHFSNMPIIDLNLPADFFYPFTGTANLMNLSIILLLLPVVLICNVFE